MIKGYARENTQQITAGHSALRKCRNAVSAGVLSPISSAVGRNGAVGDKRNARAGARNYPRRRQILRLRRCAAAPHPSRLRRATFPPGGRLWGVSFNTADPSRGRLEGCIIQRRKALKGKALGDGGRREKHLPWLGQAAASASAPVSVHAVLLTDNGDERLCPREDAGNHCRP